MGKRWVRAVLVSLVMGVVINIAVAWGLMLRFGVPTSQPRRSPEVSDEASVEWMQSVPENWPAVAHISVTCEWWCCCMYDLVHTEPYGDVPDGERDWWVRIIAWGWPCDSLGVMWTSTDGGGGLLVVFSLPDREPGLRGGLPMPAQFERRPWATRLPVMPMWPGFAVNTLLYGAVAGMVLFGPGVAKRASRRRRGACIGCGYDLIGLARCPECGMRKGKGNGAAGAGTEPEAATAVANRP